MKLCGLSRMLRRIVIPSRLRYLVIVTALLGMGLSYWIMPLGWKLSTGETPKTREQSKVVVRIRQEIEGFDNLDNFGRVEKIREWVYRNTDVAGTAGTLLRYDAHPLHLKSLDEMFQLHFDNIGGHWCAGIAFMLHRLYEALGYKSYVYHYGDQKGLTHSVTLVAVGDKIYIQDAFLNYTYVDPDGNPMPLYEILSNLTNGKEAVVKDGLPMSRDVHLANRPQTDTLLTGAYPLDGLDPNTCTAVERKHLVCRAKTTLASFIRSYSELEGAYDFLTSHGLPRNLQYLLLFPFAVFSDQYVTDPEKSDILRRSLGIAPWLHRPDGNG